MGRGRPARRNSLQGKDLRQSSRTKIKIAKIKIGVNILKSVLNNKEDEKIRDEKNTILNKGFLDSRIKYIRIKHKMKVHHM